MNNKGKAGEEFAADLLKTQGYSILAVNFSARCGEIDIIASDGQHICFVEVKTRRSGSLVSGEEAVTISKQRKIIMTALLYLQKHPCDLQPRFDVCIIETGAQGSVKCHTYISGAFDGEAYTKNH